MIKLPDINKAFQYENNFYLTCVNQRIEKILTQYKLFEKTLGIPGTIIECGVFRGVSLIRFATFRDLFSNPAAKKIIGFDTFTEYPEANSPSDKAHRENFIVGAGKDCITKPQLLSVFAMKGITNVELVEGNIVKTVPDYVKEHPELKISLLHLDCTMQTPTFTALKYFYNRIVSGGLLLLNGYGKTGVLGETNAVDEFFGKSGVVIKKLAFSYSPCYVVKEHEYNNA